MNLETIIIEAYTNGTSIAQLLRDYPTLTRGQINKILAKNNIPVRGGRKKKELTIDQIEYIKKRHLMFPPQKFYTHYILHRIKVFVKPLCC